MVMGRIKTQQVKRIGAELQRKLPGVFKRDFDENKKLVSACGEFPSKKLRNVVAGFLTRLVKKTR